MSEEKTLQSEVPSQAEEGEKEQETLTESTLPEGGPEAQEEASSPKVEEEVVDYSETFRPLAEGDVVKGTVVHIDHEGVLVDVGTKSEGLIPPGEISRGIPGLVDEPVNVGDEIDVYVLQAETEDGNILLSKKRADFEKAWERVLKAQEENRTLHAMVVDRVKGGLVVDLGIRGFIPASHVGSGKVRNLDKYIGQSLPLKVIEVDRDRRKVVLSHRIAVEEERQRQRENTLKSLREGQIRTGIVRRITDYGAFVDLGGVDGLLHISEMSWTRINHPSEVVKQGQKIQVMVLKINSEGERISLGLRQILPDPWAEVPERYKVGDVVKGKITRVVPFGAFLQLDLGIEGIIPNSELSVKRVSKPASVVQVGQTLEAKIIEIVPEERRMVLSRRQLELQREREQLQELKASQREKERFTIGDVVGDLLREQVMGSQQISEAETPQENESDRAQSEEGAS